MRGPTSVPDATARHTGRGGAWVACSAVAVAVFLLLLVPIVELYVIVQVAQEIGALNTLGLLIVVSLVGIWVVKREGLRVWDRFQQQVQARRAPTKEVADGVLLLFAGLLLVVPGFVTGVIGVLLLLPPVRALLRPLMIGRVSGSARVVRATYRRADGFRRVYDTTGREATEQDADRRDAPPPGELGEG